MKRLMVLGPMFGYFPKPEKSVLICPLANEAMTKDAFAEAGLEKVKYCRGHCYSGRFIGSGAMRDRWIEPKVDM